MAAGELQQAPLCSVIIRSSFLIQSLRGSSRHVTEAAFARWILHLASAVACLHLSCDSLGYSGAPGLGNLVLDFLSREPEAVANRNWVGLLFRTNPYWQVVAPKDGCLWIESKIDHLAVAGFAEIVLSVWHPQRQAANQALDREHVHLPGTRSIHGASHHRRDTSLFRIHRTAVGHNPSLFRFEPALGAIPRALAQLTPTTGLLGAPATIATRPSRVSAPW